MGRIGARGQSSVTYNCHVLMKNLAVVDWSNHINPPCQLCVIASCVGSHVSLVIVMYLLSTSSQYDRLFKPNYPIVSHVLLLVAWPVT